MGSEYDDKFGLLRADSGKWTVKPQPDAEASVVENLATVPVILLADGEGDALGGGDSGTPIEHLYISRNDYDTPHTYNIEVTQRLNFHDLLSDDLGTHDDKERWLDERRGIIDDFMKKRYDADIGSFRSWMSVAAEMRVSHVGQVTEEQAFNLGWNGTKTVDLYNEYDAGTDGSEYLGRLLEEHCAEFSVATDVDRRAASKLTDRFINSRVASSLGHREVRGDVAMAIAGHFCSQEPNETPWLRNLSTFGYARTVELDEELRQLEPQVTEANRARFEALVSWNKSGGESE